MRPFDKRQSPGVVGKPIDFDFMPPEAWLDFHCELYDVVDELDLAVASIDNGVIQLTNGRALGLLQLAQHCHLRHRNEWHELITRYLRTMTAHLGDDVEPFSMFDLRIRLVPDCPADREIFEHLGARPFAEGVVQMLAVDVPGAVRSVPVREIEEYGWDVEEAWASAWAQTETLEHPDEVHVIDVGGATLTHVFGERSFTSSLVRVIDQIVGPFDERGAIVAIPIRHSMLVHPIRDASARTAAAALIPITRQLHRQGPGSVSAHLYWWRDGELTWIPTYFGPDGMECYLPPDLVDVLDELGG